MKQFEYKTVKVKINYDDGSSKKSKGLKELFIAEDESTIDTNEVDYKFNELGQEGWELVSTMEKQLNNSTTILLGIFKRVIE